MLPFEDYILLKTLEAKKGEPFIYVLDLEGGNKYVGHTRNIKSRLKDHYDGQGAIWTKKHKPLRIHKIEKIYGWSIYKDKTPISREMMENWEMCLYFETVRNFGKDKVRGSYWVNLSGNLNYYTPKKIRERFAN